MGITIRPMAEADRPAVLALLMELTGHEASLSPERGTGPEVAAACLADDSDKAIETGGALMVAESEGRVVGYLALQLGRTGPFVHEHLRDHLYIENIVVGAAQRGTGIGQVLLAEAERFARATGRKVLRLGVLPGNDLALKAYRRAGFEVASLDMMKLLD